MGSSFSDMEGKQTLYIEDYTYDDGFGYAEACLPPSAPALPTVPTEEHKADAQEEERRVAMAIMVSLEPELQQGNISQWSFWQIEQPADASSRSTPLASARQHHQNRSSSRRECKYCYDAPIGATCDPCGHVACFNCWVKIQESDNKCPRCLSSDRENHQALPITLGFEAIEQFCRC